MIDDKASPEFAGRWEEQKRLTAEQAVRELQERDVRSPRDEWWIREAGEFAKELSGSELSSRLKYWGGSSILALEKRHIGEEILEQAGITFARGEPDGLRHLRFRVIGEREVTMRLFDELPLVARRLVGEQQELFLEANRMKGEVEFRYALAIPIPITASVLAFGLGLPIWVWITASVAGILAGWALLEDAWRRDGQRNDLLVELLAIGRAKSPTVERLLERARQPGRPTAANPPRSIGA